MTTARGLAPEPYFDEKSATWKVTCVCGSSMNLETGFRTEDLQYRCGDQACRLTHGAHGRDGRFPGHTAGFKRGQPLGIPCDIPTKHMRHDAHFRFDQLWKTGLNSRNESYTMLSKLLGIPPEQAHIGRFSLAQCQDLIGTLDAMLSIVNESENSDEQLRQDDPLGVASPTDVAALSGASLGHYGRIQQGESFLFRTASMFRLGRVVGEASGDRLELRVYCVLAEANPSVGRRVSARVKGGEWEPATVIGFGTQGSVEVRLDSENEVAARTQPCEVDCRVMQQASWALWDGTWEQPSLRFRPGFDTAMTDRSSVLSVPFREASDGHAYKLVRERDAPCSPCGNLQGDASRFVQ